jgi:hypothetical protein
MRATWSCLAAWPAKVNDSLAWLLLHFGIVRDARDEEGGEHAYG